MSSKNRACTALLMLWAAGCSPQDSDVLEPLDADSDWLPVMQPVQVSPKTDATLNSLWVRPDGGEAWAVGTGGSVVHGAAGRWTSALLGNPSDTWNSVAFDDAGRFGIAVGSAGRVATYGSTDTIWRFPEIPAGNENLTSVWLSADGTEAFVTGYGGTVLRLSRGAWARLPITPGVRLADVAATGSELWVRDSARVVAFSRSDWHRTRELDDFDAGHLWGTRDPLALWIGGVSHPVGHGPPPARRFTIRRYRGQESDSLLHVPLMPRAAAFSKDFRYGIAVGRIPLTNERYTPHYGFRNPRGWRSWALPGSPHIKGIWLNDSATAGWMVGERGYVAKIGQWRPDVQGLSWTHGSISRLSGRYTIDGELSDSIPLDSIRVVGESDTLRLLPPGDFSIPSRRKGIDFIISNPAQEQALERFHGKRVNLQIFLSVPLEDSLYAVGWKKAHPFTIDEPKPCWPWVTGIVVLAVLVTALLFGLRHYRRLHDILSDPDASEVFGKAGKITVLLLRYAPALRRMVLDRYRKDVVSLYALPAYDPPRLKRLSGDCKALVQQDGPITTKDDPEIVTADQAVLAGVYPTMRQPRTTRVLWIEGGEQGSLILQALVQIVADQGGIPVYINQKEPGTIKEIATREWAHVYSIGEDTAAQYIKYSDNVFLLDCVRGGYDKDMVREFVAQTRVRNVVVVASTSGPTITRVCHVKVVA